MNIFKINIEKFDDWPPIIAIVDDRLKEEAVDVTGMLILIPVEDIR